MMRRIIRTSMGVSESKMKKLQNKKCSGLYSPLNITRIIKLEEWDRRSMWHASEEDLLVWFRS